MAFHWLQKFSTPKKPEARVFQKPAVVIDVFLIGFTFLIPVVIWIASLLPINSVNYNQFDHVVMIGYIIFALVMTLVHNRTACSNCDITDCWLCAGRKYAGIKEEYKSNIVVIDWVRSIYQFPK